jgi:hypothetical protein
MTERKCAICGKRGSVCAYTGILRALGYDPTRNAYAHPACLHRAVMKKHGTPRAPQQ